VLFCCPFFALAQRGEIQIGVFLSHMDTNLQPQPETTVEEALSACPDLYTIFLRGKAECIGCFLQKFCTLREVTGAYRVPLEGFLAEVEMHVQAIHHTQRSSHEKIVQDR
jgi:hypothetical protein